MADPMKPDPDSSTLSPTGPKYSAPKDRTCQFCGQSFTSSSLGRHLDLYIKSKNPKAPDGVHDVDAIRRIRGNITRRQPRHVGAAAGSSPSTPTPASTPRHPDPGTGPFAAASASASARGSGGEDVEMASSVDSPTPAASIQGRAAGRALPPDGPFAPRWDGGGRSSHTSHSNRNSISTAAGNANGAGDMTRKPAAAVAAVGSESGSRSSRTTLGPRAVSKQILLKTQLETKSKLTDAVDTARASELALREVLSSWRAAKQHVENSSMPFDFSPMTLDFPAFTLQCLPPPPTIFSSTPHPTATSWSIAPPAGRELAALRKYIRDEFAKWKASCLRATSSLLDEQLIYPPAPRGGAAAREQGHETLRRAEEQADSLERQVLDHLDSAFSAWEGLPAQRRAEVWVLEMARGVGRARADADRLREERDRLAVENANLKSQIDNLNRLQQPREFTVLAPATLPFERRVVDHLLEQGPLGGKGLGPGLLLEDRHMDLNTAVGRSIERWKAVIAAARAASSSMAAQRALDAPTIQTAAAAAPSVTAIPPPAGAAAATGPASSKPSHVQPPTPPERLLPRPAAASAHPNPPRTALPSEDGDEDDDEEEDDEDDAAATTAVKEAVVGTRPAVVDPDVDADAEMDEDDSPPPFNVAHPSTPVPTATMATDVGPAPQAQAPIAPLAAQQQQQRQQDQYPQEQYQPQEHYQQREQSQHTHHHQQQPQQQQMPPGQPQSAGEPRQHNGSPMRMATGLDPGHLAAFLASKSIQQQSQPQSSIHSTADVGLAIQGGDHQMYVD